MKSGMDPDPRIHTSDQGIRIKFLLDDRRMIEGSGDGSRSTPLTYGSGSGRRGPKTYGSGGSGFGFGTLIKSIGVRKASYRTCELRYSNLLNALVSFKIFEDSYSFFKYSKDGKHVRTSIAT
jgi:hypothetical protein